MGKRKPRGSTFKEMCTALDVGERQGYAYIDRGMPRNRDKSFDIPACLEWQAKNVRESAGNHKKRTPVDPTSEEAMLDPAVTGTSPALERFRNARAGLAELELEVKRGQFLPLDLVHSAHGRIQGVLRSSGEIFRKNWGPECLAVLNEALNECRAIVAELCKSAGEGGDAEGIRLDAAGLDGPPAPDAN